MCPAIRSIRLKTAEKFTTNLTSRTCLNRKWDDIVIKPDAGTHGKGIVLSKNRDELLVNIEHTEASIINPVGVVAQELIEKWFYDLRIIVYKEKRKDPVCHPVAMARAGFSDFRTNTFPWQPRFRREIASAYTRIGCQMWQSVGREHEAWVFAMDAMINVGKNKNADDETLKAELAKAGDILGGSEEC